MTNNGHTALPDNEKLRPHWVSLIRWIGIAFVGCTVIITFLLCSLRSCRLTKSLYDDSSSHSSQRELLQWGKQFQGYNCINERWNHGTKMYKNTFLCSMKNSFVWGVTKNGDFLWKDLATGKTRMYYKNIYNHTSNYFYLTRNGKFQVIGDRGEISWEKYPGSYKNIGYHVCLTNFACPYLHLHPDGVIVLNWVDPTYGFWITKNINTLYGI